MSKFTFENILDRDGILVYKTKGVSMRPLLRQDRDLVVIEKKDPQARLERFDVALYKRGEQYVLHRVIYVRDGRYDIRGDNTFMLEQVPEKAVIGVLKSIKRSGRSISTSDKGYMFYVRFWNLIYPIRYLIRGTRVFGGRIKKKLKKIKKSS